MTLYYCTCGQEFQVGSRFNGYIYAPHFMQREGAQDLEFSHCPACDAWLPGAYAKNAWTDGWQDVDEYV
jgi:hypothetical protein